VQTGGKPAVTCATRSRPATSNTGDTRPFQSGIATIVIEVFVEGVDSGGAKVALVWQGAAAWRACERLRAFMVLRSSDSTPQVRLRGRM